MSRCRVDQKSFGFGDRCGMRGSSLGDLAIIIGWGPVKCTLLDISNVAKGEPAWSDRPYFEGESFTVADAYLYALEGWSRAS